MELLPLQLVLSLAMFAFVTSITPGPNNMMLLASGVNHGFAGSLRLLFGIEFGFFILLSAVGLGLGELFVALPMAHTAMKWLGVAYMLYLAWGLAHSAGSGAEGDGGKTLGFWGAVAFQWINPKAWIMAIGYFSTYVPAGKGPIYLVGMAALFAIVGLPCCAAWALMGQHLRRYLADAKQRQVFNWVMAVLLVLSIIPALL
ncbi:LysE family translocator [Rhodoferax aquaticus]|uniref:LysE family translocator n=1 Tax=Rhodoferax aquaticus TaxID=2527691 RepID=A0A515EM19_9BURK|nr:LysE family translocator [Rhodoferax aquaticus]QDL53689.1 LysE family translocator [Rhodoferax aquaticus]